MDTLMQALSNPAVPMLAILIGGGVLLALRHRHEGKVEDRLAEREQERRYMESLDPITRGPAQVFTRPLDPREGNEWEPIGTAEISDELDFDFPVDRSLRAQVERRVDNPRLDWSRYPYDRHGGPT